MTYHITSMPTQNPSRNMLLYVSAWHQRSRLCLESTWTLIHPPQPTPSTWFASASTKNSKNRVWFPPASINIHKQLNEPNSSSKRTWRAPIAFRNLQVSTSLSLRSQPLWWCSLNKVGQHPGTIPEDPHFAAKLYIYLSNYLSVYLSIYLPIYLSIYLLSI